MSRRKARRANEAAPRPLGDVFGHSEPGPDGEMYTVRTVPGGRALKPYRCPGCDHEIAPGVAHVVAWPAYGGGDDRRHWHRGCWNGRATRRITRRWS